MLSKPSISPPRQLALAGCSFVPSTSVTVALYSAVFKRCIRLAPGAPLITAPAAPPLGLAVLPPPGNVAAPPAPPPGKPGLPGLPPPGPLPATIPVQPARATPSATTEENVTTLFIALTSDQNSNTRGWERL